MSDHHSTRTGPNRRVAELRSQAPSTNNALPVSTYIRSRVDELKQDADHTKECLREIASAMVRVDDMCFEEFGRVHQRLYYIEQNLVEIAEKQARSTREIKELMEEVLGRMKGGSDARRPTVHWASDPPNGEEPRGKGEPSSGSERQFNTNEDF
jgi:hypothetical protein